MFIDNHTSRSRLLNCLVTLPVAIFFLCTTQVTVAADIFLQIEGVRGESDNRDFKQAIDVLEWSWGMAQSGSSDKGTGRGAGKVDVEDLTFTHYVDSATPALMQACASGDHFDKVRLTLVRSADKRQAYVVIDLERVLVSSIATGGAEGSDRPIEEVSLNFATVKVSYRPFDARGGAGETIEFSWDVASNMKL